MTHYCVCLTYYITVIVFSSNANTNTQEVVATTDHTYKHLYDDARYPPYNSFLYTSLSVTPTKVKAGNNVTLNFNITNTGTQDGTEVYEVYISWLNATVPTPRYQLVNFNRTLVMHGQTVPIRCNVTSQQMAVWIDGKGFVIEPGEIEVYAGGQLPTQKSKVQSNILTSIFIIFT